MQYIVGGIVLWNLFVMFLYWLDKQKAIKNKRRISEFQLLWPAFITGGAGAAIGMFWFRHKTKHPKFKLMVPLALVINGIEFYCIYNAASGFLKLL